jgi:cytochrome c oxidase assembly protein subunit 11
MSDRQAQQDQSPTGTGKLVARLLLTVVGMFGFGFALVPMYDVFCEWTGLNGKTGGRYEYSTATAEINKDRLVTVQFAANNNSGMAWEFGPMVNQVQVHPGELTEVKFYARNPAATRIVGQAVPSVVPFVAADYLRKTECFCFTQQVLEAGEAIEMPVFFYVDAAIPANVSKLTLTYTLFDVTANFVEAGTTLSAK